MTYHTIASTGFPNNVTGWKALQAIAPTFSREAIIAILAWNDSNGTYTDADSRAEGMDPLSHAEALAILQSISTF